MANTLIAKANLEMLEEAEKIRVRRIISQSRLESRTRTQPQETIAKRTLDILMIGAAPLRTIRNDKKAEFFYSSIEEIDSILASFRKVTGGEVNSV
jgi:hypothetical protein